MTNTAVTDTPILEGSPPGPSMPAKARPLPRFVREECPDYVAARGCWRLKGRECLVIEGERCREFETSIFPIAVRSLRLLRNKDKQDDRRVVEAYLCDHAELRETLVPERDNNAVRPCPDCGAPLAPRARFCETCRVARRRKSDRRQKARQRGGCPTVNPEKGGQNRPF